MAKPITLPVYRNLSLEYGIVFTTDNSSPILINWETLEISRMKLDIDSWNSHQVKQEDQIDAYESTKKLLYIRIHSNHFEIDLGEEPPSRGWSRMSGPMYEGLKVVNSEILKREKFQSRDDSLRALYTSEKLRVMTKMKTLRKKTMQQVTKPDFIITSDENGSFPVHSLLLSFIWPFFETASTIQMSEKDAMKLHLPYSKECVEILINFFYGKEITLTWESALTLLSISALYDIPELKRLVSLYLSSHSKKLTFESTMKGWKVAHETGTSELELVFAQFLKSHVRDIADAAEDYSETQLLELLCQVVKL